MNIVFDVIIKYIFNRKLKSSIILLLISPFTFADNRPGFVCGKFNGHVIEVPKSYIIYWAEYEGASSFNPDFVNNKKGCDANFRSLPMIANWPDMQPGDQLEWGNKKHGFNGLTINVVPLQRPDTDVAYRRKFFLRDQEDRRFDPMIYHEALNLYSVKATRKLHRPKGWDRNDPALFDEDINNYYWAEIDGRIPVVFDCTWLPLQKRYFTCKAYFVMPEIGGLVKVIFTPEKLAQWQQIINKTQAFLLSKTKHKGE